MDLATADPKGPRPGRNALVRTVVTGWMPRAGGGSGRLRRRGRSGPLTGLVPSGSSRSACVSVKGVTSSRGFRRRPARSSTGTAAPRSPRLRFGSSRARNVLPHHEPKRRFHDVRPSLLERAPPGPSACFGPAPSHRLCSRESSRTLSGSLRDNGHRFASPRRRPLPDAPSGRTRDPYVDPSTTNGVGESGTSVLSSLDRRTRAS
jgi:hypothetical protein